MTGEDRDLETWLRRLRWGLAALPESERDDIVRETRAHIEESMANGRTAREAIGAFGPAEDYARAFIEERELVAAVGSEAPGSMFAVVLKRAHKSLVAASAFLLVAFIAMGALVVVAVAVIKIDDPAHAGLWIGPRQFFLGVIDDPSSAHELLGNAIYLLPPLAIVAAWYAGRSVLLWSIRRMARG